MDFNFGPTANKLIRLVFEVRLKNWGDFDWGPIRYGRGAWAEPEVGQCGGSD